MAPMSCANCGELGHVYKKCSKPVTSFGVICVRYSRFYQYLMVQRKDSLAYIEFMRGKYQEKDLDYLSNLFSHMTHDELSRMCHLDFPKLWCLLWQIEDCSSFRREYENSSEKFSSLKESGILSSIIAEKLSLGHYFKETEWGFAKGRRNIGESDYNCAIREFYEESGVPSNINIVMLMDRPVEETFVGSNGLTYRHVYYVGAIPQLPDSFLLRPGGDAREVSRAAWFTYDEARSRMRDYDVERLKLIEDVNKTLIRVRTWGESSTAAVQQQK